MRKSILTLGTFDGVHRGHQALIRQVVALARRLRANPVALAFNMPPRHAGKPLTTPVLLSTWEEKQARFAALGIRNLIPLRFNRKTAHTPAKTFFEKFVVRRFNASDMVVGPKLAFGRNREGTLARLREFGVEAGVRVHVVRAVGRGRNEVSSRRIRALLQAGKLKEANRLLGYSYSIRGKVIHGDHRGRKLGFPTANIKIPTGKILPLGVYWVKVRKGSSLRDGICNVGVRPTFKHIRPELRCEVHVLGNIQDLYGEILEVIFKRKIRGEMKFSSPEQLTRQIARDLRKALLYRKHDFSI